MRFEAPRGVPGGYFEAQKFLWSALGRPRGAPGAPGGRFWRVEGRESKTFDLFSNFWAQKRHFGSFFGALLGVFLATFLALVFGGVFGPLLASFWDVLGVVFGLFLAGEAGCEQKGGNRILLVKQMKY